MKKLLCFVMTLIMIFSLTAVSSHTVLALEDEDIELTEDKSSFTIHFIDVGQADAALVLCDDSAMLIDGGNAADSDLIYSYLKKHDVDHLDYIVCTHAHEDHVGGLAGALNYASVDTALCPVTSYDSKAFKSFVKYLKKQDVEITVPEAGNTYSLGSSEFEILGPINDDGDGENNSSIVIRIVYKNTSFLFTGDAELEEEEDIIDEQYTLESTLLKVAHHGSETSTSYGFLNEVLPEYAVISVGKNNSYGHPSEDVLSRLRDADATVYRTDMQGDIICTSDGESLSFTVEKNADADTLESVKKTKSTKANTDSDSDGGKSSKSSGGTPYVLNTNTNKFHNPSCSSVKQMKDKNRKDYTGTRKEIIDMGYDPCKKCNP